MKGVTEKETRQGKIVSQIISSIFYLNNQQVRYKFSYEGYLMKLEKYSFDMKEYTEVMEVNVTKHKYSYVNKILDLMLGILEKEMVKLDDDYRNN